MVWKLSDKLHPVQPIRDRMLTDGHCIDLLKFSFFYVRGDDQDVERRRADNAWVD